MQAPQPRVVMIGESSVGKTALVYRMCRGEWMSISVPTVTTSFFSYQASDGQEIQFWDTAGAERYRALNSVYYHNASGGILVFDLTNRQSFDSLTYWVDEFMELAQPGAILAIVGNKSDLNGQIQVKPEEGEKWAAAHNFKFFTTSAQTGENVADLAEYMAKSLPNRSFSYLPPSVALNKKKKGEESQNDLSCC
ncbi:small GTP-binding protein [Tritrichomonas foetus]|uniref:Small GTP-binding protein n=1 Tax=Tritrichomonas foetus TaxID=1144522 RepID=A0A1J4KI65_9EUKA|nr:small GTP-binding protein [Tritrichomonas foetus]|eukprot:OHT10632.1 small GTP-binding protein [Tritrichomonas foetus]